MKTIVTLCRYDKNHQLVCCTTEGQPASIKLLKHEKDLVDVSPQILDEFISAYELSVTRLNDHLKNITKLNQHIERIHSQYLCDSDLLNGTLGMTHLMQQKQLLSRMPIRKSEPAAPSQRYKEATLAMANALIANANPSTMRSLQYNLPLVDLAVSILNTPFYQDSYKSVLNNTLVVLVQQGFSTTKHTIKGLIDIGITPTNIILMTKPHTTTVETDAIFNSVQRSYGIQYVAPARFPEYPDDYIAVAEDSHRRLIEAIRASLMHGIKNIVLHDEGGKVASSSQFTEAWLSWRQQGVNLCTSEHTMSGIASRRQTALGVPCIDMGESCVKAEVEAELISETFALEAKRIIDELVAAARQKRELQGGIQPLVVIGMIGVGNIGSQFVRFLTETYRTEIELLIGEVKPDSEKYRDTRDYLATQSTRVQYYTPLENIEGAQYCADESSAKIIELSDIVFGCTGKDISTRVIPRAQERGDTGLEPRTTVLCSVSSGDREFKRLILDCYAARATLNAFASVGSDYHCQIAHTTFRIKHRGRPINFNGGSDAVHPTKIQLTRAMTVLSVVQALQYLSLLPQMALSDNPENKQKLLAYNDSVTPFVRINETLQLYLYEKFIQFHQILKERYGDVAAADVHHPLHHALLNDNMLQRQFSIERVARHSGGREALKMDHSQPHACNLIGFFDKNHALHVLNIDDVWVLRFVKHKKILKDNEMRQLFLTQSRIDMNTFLTSSVFDQLLLFSQLSKQRTEHALGTVGNLFPQAAHQSLGFFCAANAVSSRDIPAAYLESAAGI